MFPLCRIRTGFLSAALLLAGAPTAHAEEGHLATAPLPTLCRDLSRRYGATIRVSRGLEELRVLWSDRDVADARTAVDRLTELTDSLVDARSGANGRKTFTLEPRTATKRREELWKTATLVANVQSLAQAYERQEKGDPQAADAGSSAGYLKADQNVLASHYIRALTPDQLVVLTRGDEVRRPGDLLTEAEHQRMFTSIWGTLDKALGNASGTEKRVVASVEQVRRDGIGVYLDLSRAHGDFVHVMLRLGSQSGGTAIAIGRFSDVELGLPLTRTSPYRFLEMAPAAKPPAPVLTGRLAGVLDAPLTLPAGATWRAALDLFTRQAGLPAASDDYLCRTASSRAPGVSKGLVLERGTPIADAMDRLCNAYGYLWWEKNGCCYFRSRYWPYDVETEVPPHVLDTVVAALGRDGQLGAPEINALASLIPPQLHGLTRLNVEGEATSGRFFPDSLLGFLRLFAHLTPGEQAGIMGAGSVVRSDAEPSFDFLRQMGSKEPRQIVVQLEQKVTRIPEQASHGWKIQCRIILKRPGDEKGSWAPFELLIPDP